MTKIWQKRIGCDFWDQVTNRLRLLFWFSSFSLAWHCDGSQIPCYDARYGKGTWQGTDRSLYPIASIPWTEVLSPTNHKELNLVQNHVNEARSRSSLVGPPDGTMDLIVIMIAVWWETLEMEDPANLCLDSQKYRNWEIINIWCFRLLYFGGNLLNSEAFQGLVSVNGDPCPLDNSFPSSLWEGI